MNSPWKWRHLSWFIGFSEVVLVYYLGLRWVFATGPENVASEWCETLCLCRRESRYGRRLIRAEWMVLSQSLLRLQTWLVPPLWVLQNLLKAYFQFFLFLYFIAVFVGHHIANCEQVSKYRMLKKSNRHLLSSLVFPVLRKVWAQWIAVNSIFKVQNLLFKGRLLWKYWEN